MSFKDISYLKHLSLVKLKHLCIFGRMHHEEQFCDIILNLDQSFRVNAVYFLSRALAALLFSVV